MPELLEPANAKTITDRSLTGYGRPPSAVPLKSSTKTYAADHHPIALIADDKDLQFRSALASRDVIGQAKGMIMERFAVDPVRAFELLRKLSQDSNVPLVQIAVQLVERGSASNGT